eukprot:PhM_4_TR6853/c0_g1_i1/m.1921
MFSNNNKSSSKLIRQLSIHPSRRFMFVYKPQSLLCAEDYLKEGRALRDVYTSTADTALRRASEQFGRRVAGLPVPMQFDVRGALCVTTTREAFSVLDACRKLGVFKRTYTIVCERNPTASRAPRGVIDVDVAPFLSSKTASTRALRIADLFLPPGSAKVEPHPWMAPSDLLRVVPQKTFARIRSDHSSRLYATYRVVEEGNRYRMLEVELVQGHEHGLRCALADMHMPIVGDLRYNSNDYFPLWSRVALEHSITDNDIDRLRRLGRYDQGHAEQLQASLASDPDSQNVGFAMCCTGITFPDPTLEKNIIHLRHLNFHSQFGGAMTVNPTLIASDTTASGASSGLLKPPGERGKKNTSASAAGINWVWYSVRTPCPRGFYDLVHDRTPVRNVDELATVTESEANEFALAHNEKSIKQAMEAGKDWNVRLYHPRLLHDGTISTTNRDVIIASKKNTEIKRLADDSGNDSKENTSTRRVLNGCIYCQGAHHYTKCPRLNEESRSDHVHARKRMQINDSESQDLEHGGGSSSPKPSASSSASFCVCCGEVGHLYHACSKRHHNGCRICGEIHLEDVCPMKKPAPRGFSEMGARRLRGSRSPSALTSRRSKHNRSVGLGVAVELD